MITRPCAVVVPRNVDEAIAAVTGTAGDATVIGGGTWVVPEMTNRKREPALVVDLRRAGLESIMLDRSVLVIGATCTYQQLAASALVRQHFPALITLALGITGGAQIRSWGTLGGAACYASPSSDVPGALVGLDATVRLRSAAGTRDVRAVDFFLDAYSVDLGREEIMIEIRLPLPSDGTTVGYHKLTLCTSSWPIVTATAIVGERGEARVSLGGVGRVPVTAFLEADPSAEADSRAIMDAFDTAATAPWADVLADAVYRRHVAPVVARRSIAAARGLSAQADR